jgi:hypothetical protein
LTVRMSDPVANDPAGTVNVALPLPRTVAVDAKVPLVSLTEPVGVGLLLPPLTATITVSACEVVMLDEDTVTVTLGVIVDDEPV